MIVENSENEVQFLRSENLRLKNNKRWLTEKYIELFISYAELLDEYMPEWRFHCKDKINELIEMIK